MTAYDFAPYWWDPTTEGPSNGLYLVDKGVGWYVDGGKRYVATDVAEEAVRLVRQVGVDQLVPQPPRRPAGVRR